MWKSKINLPQFLYESEVNSAKNESKTKKHCGRENNIVYVREPKFSR